MSPADVKQLAEQQLIHPSWISTLEPLQTVLSQLGDMLRKELADGHQYLPQPKHILRSLTLPLQDVRVVIVGQDPYPTVGHPIGLSFAVQREVKSLPRSLKNIYRELADDVGIPPAAHGDLSNWTDQGVMLLNRVLTVRAGMPGSHRGRGWEQITQAVLEALGRRGGPLVGLLWGADARRAGELLGNTPTVESAHPSPLSAHRGFFGSKPFSKVNELLIAQGANAIDWRVEKD